MTNTTSSTMYETRLSPTARQAQALLHWSDLQARVQRLCYEQAAAALCGQHLSLTVLAGGQDDPGLSDLEALRRLPDFQEAPAGVISHAADGFAARLAQARQETPQLTLAQLPASARGVMLGGPRLLRPVSTSSVHIDAIPGTVQANLHRLPRWARAVCEAEALGQPAAPLDTTDGPVDLTDARRVDMAYITREIYRTGVEWILELHFAWPTYTPWQLAPLFEAGASLPLHAERIAMAEIMGWSLAGWSGRPEALWPPQD